MNERPTEIGVIIVAYNSREDLTHCLAGIERWAGDAVKLRVVVVDCDSHDGSAELVRELFPEIDLIKPGRNLGFAGGNNLGWEHLQQRYPSIRYVALLNPDTIPEPGWLDPLVTHLDQYPNTATCQPLVTLADRPGHINTAGNAIHYLGFGLVTRCGEPIPNDMTVQPIGYSSGAAMLARADLLARFGLFESPMFLYCEDTDLGMKLRQLGYQHELVPQSRVAHRFSDSAAIGRHYYYLERNRMWLISVYHKYPTLVLLMPAILLMEVGQLLFAFSHGRLLDKLRTYGFFIPFRTGAYIMQLREAAQRRRTISDRECLRTCVGRIDHPGLGGPLLRYVGNPLLGAYWWLIKRVIFW